MKSQLKIGFVGLGNMGYHMANNLIKNNFQMVLHDINTEVLDKFNGKNITKVHSPKEVADISDLVFVSLPSPRASLEVALGNEGLIHGSRINTYIDLSTCGPKTSSEIGETLIEKGIKVLDSPVSGGVIGAKNGSLSLMIAGDKKTFEVYFEILNKIGNKVMYVGEEVSQGQVMKVINNLLSSAALAITSEAIVLGAKAGLDPTIMIDVLNASSGRNSATEDKFKRSILNRKFDYGFHTALAYKDIKLCLDLAQDLKVPMWLGSNIEHFWRFALNQGPENQDYTSIIKHFEEWAGIEVSEKEMVEN